jgi:hypothetical protein
MELLAAFDGVSVVARLIAIIVKGLRIGEHVLVLDLTATHDFTQNARLSR